MPNMAYIQHHITPDLCERTGQDFPDLAIGQTHNSQPAPKLHLAVHVYGMVLPALPILPALYMGHTPSRQEQDGTGQEGFPPAGQAPDGTPNLGYHPRQDH